MALPEWLRSGLCRARIVVTVVAIMAVGAFVSTIVMVWVNTVLVLPHVSATVQVLV